MSLPSEVI